MSFDPVKNLLRQILATGYNATAVSITVPDGSKFPNPSTDGAYNIIWYNITDFPDVVSDPNAEIVRVTAKTGNTLTITRAQEGTSASTKNTAGKQYAVMSGFTKKTYDDFANAINNKANTSDLGETAFSNDYNDLDNLPNLSQFITDLSSFNTDDLSEGSTNKYFTDERVLEALVDITAPNEVLFRNSDGEVSSDPFFIFNETTRDFSVLGLFGIGGGLIQLGDLADDYFGTRFAMNYEVGDFAIEGVKNGYIRGEINTNGDVVSYEIGEIDPFGGVPIPGIGMTYESVIDDTIGVFGFADATSLGSTSGIFTARNQKGDVITDMLMHPDLGFSMSYDDGVNAIGFGITPTSSYLSFQDIAGTLIKSLEQSQDGVRVANVAEVDEFYYLPDEATVPTTVDNAMLQYNQSNNRIEFRNTLETDYLVDLQYDVSGNVKHIVNNPTGLFDVIPFVGVTGDDGTTRAQLGITDLTFLFGSSGSNAIYAFASEESVGETGMGVIPSLATFISNNLGNEGVDLVEYSLIWSGPNKYAGFRAYSDIDGYDMIAGITEFGFGFEDSILGQKYYLPMNFPTSNYDEIEVVDYTTGQTQWNKKTGSYTPTLTGVTNVASLTPYAINYFKVGDMVTVSGQVDVESVANNTQTSFRVSLPIASDFASSLDCTGLMHTLGSGTAGHGGAIIADTTNNEALVTFYETHTSAETIVFSFTYKIA